MEVKDWSDQKLRAFLLENNVEIGPLTPTTRQLYSKKATELLQSKGKNTSTRSQNVAGPSTAERRRQSVSPTRRRKSTIGVGKEVATESTSPPPWQSSPSPSRRRTVAAPTGIFPQTAVASQVSPKKESNSRSQSPSHRQRPSVSQNKVIPGVKNTFKLSPPKSTSTPLSHKEHPTTVGKDKVSSFTATTTVNRPISQRSLPTFGWTRPASSHGNQLISQVHPRIPVDSAHRNNTREQFRAWVSQALKDVCDRGRQMLQSTPDGITTASTALSGNGLPTTTRRGLGRFHLRVSDEDDDSDVQGGSGEPDRRYAFNSARRPIVWWRCWMSERWLNFNFPYWLIAAVFAVLLAILLFIIHNGSQTSLSPKISELKKFICIETNNQENDQHMDCLSREEVIQASKDLDALQPILVELSREYIRAYPSLTSARMNCEVARLKLAGHLRQDIDTRRWFNVLRILLKMGRYFYGIVLLNGDADREVNELSGDLMAVEYLQSLDQEVSSYYRIRFTVLRQVENLLLTISEWWLSIVVLLLVVGGICTGWIARLAYVRRQRALERDLDVAMGIVIDHVREQYHHYHDRLASYAYLPMKQLREAVRVQLPRAADDVFWRHLCSRVYYGHHCVGVEHLRGIGEIWRYQAAS